MNRRSQEDEIFQAMESISRITESYHEQLARALAPGLHRGALQPLIMLYREGPARVNELAAQLGLDRTTVTRHLDELAYHGLVTRNQDPADRRAILVGLSATAEEKLDQARRESRTRVRRLYSNWDAGERSVFQNLLSRFVIAATAVYGTTGGDRAR